MTPSQFHIQATYRGQLPSVAQKEVHPGAVHVHAGGGGQGVYGTGLALMISALL